MRPDSTSKVARGSAAGSPPYRRALLRSPGRLLRLLSAGLAVLLIPASLLSSAGLMDWQGWGTLVGEPWNGLINSEWSPKTIFLDAGGAVAFLLLWGTARVIGSSRARAVLGEGTLVLFRRLIYFVSTLLVVTAGYLLVQVSSRTLRADLQVHGEPVSLTLPTLCVILVFSLATMTLPPSPGKRYLHGSLDRIAYLAILPAALAVVLFLDAVSPSPRLWSSTSLAPLITQIALSGVEIAFVLAVIESLAADIDDLRMVRPNASVHESDTETVTHLQSVIPAEAGIHRPTGTLGSRFRGNYDAKSRAANTHPRPAEADHGPHDRFDSRKGGLRGWLSALFGLTRAGLRLAVLVGPILMGYWLTLGAPLPEASRLMDRSNGLIEYYSAAGENRVAVPPSDVSPWMKKAIDAIEDPGVYTSPFTYVPVSLIRAVGIFSNAVRGLQGDGGSLSGGSGIPAQSCKNYYGRPLVETVSNLPGSFLPRRLLVVAATIVQKPLEFECGWAFARSSLLLGGDRSPVGFYLNDVYFGRGAYGVELAARTYFGKDAAQLTAVEAALLAGIPQAPGGSLDPWEHPERALARRSQVLQAMAREGYISTADMKSMERAPLGVLPSPLVITAPDKPTVQFIGYLRSWLDRQGIHDLSTGGYTVVTTLDPQRQSDLAKVVRGTVQSLGDRQVNNGAAVVLDARTGQVLAWFGGLQPMYGQDSLPDMVSGFPHDPGSTVKPLLYSCALEEGKLQPNERLDDTPRVIGGKPIANWDLDPKGRGMQPAREELANSRNTAAAELVDRLTPEGFAQCLSTRFHVKSDLQPSQYGVDLGLGLSPMPMLELAAAYTVLANDGIYAEPTPVVSVRDRHGRELYRSSPATAPSVVSPDTLSWIGEALGEVSSQLGIQPGVATKTGSTSSSSYVAGYDGRVVLAAWLGRTEPGRSIMAIDDVEGREAAWAIWRAQAGRSYPGEQ